MCGLAGIYARPDRRPDPTLLMTMAGELRHRGPDAAGLYLDDRFGMAATRLAIVDLEGGDQPLADERRRHWVMQNGEIYNYVELRSELRSLGHGFETHSDTEVIAHAYEEWGPDCLTRFNGDFAIAVWDRERRELFLARDRFGVRPLYVAELDGDLCFASEAKALLRHPDARRELDAAGIVAAFTFWSPLPHQSAFSGIRELPPAHYIFVRPDGIGSPVKWWDLEFAPDERPKQQLLEELETLLTDSVRLRLRADVSVAAYISGGIDSSVVAAAAARDATRELHAFGLGFDDERFDESTFQDAVVERLQVPFHRTVVDAATIGELLPRAVELAEVPLLRTAPAPLLRLSEAVHDAGVRVVLTGEGADELFAGYDIFREDKVRRFWARDPSSQLRPKLFTRLNRFLAVDPARSGRLLDEFYGRGLLELDDPLYSHRLRFTNTARAVRLLDRELVARVEEDALYRPLVQMLPPRFAELSPLSRAQYLETLTFLQGFLLHAQGDRMLMGNSVEGRFPFLDYRVAELAARLPDSLRLLGLREKHALRRAMAAYVPPAVERRPKQPYRAPIAEALAAPSAPDYVDELLRPDRIADAGLLDATAVERLLRKVRTSGGTRASETEEMGLVGCVTLMLLHDRFVKRQPTVQPLQPQRVVVGDVVDMESSKHLATAR